MLGSCDLSLAFCILLARLYQILFVYKSTVYEGPVRFRREMKAYCTAAGTDAQLYPIAFIFLLQ